MSASGENADIFYVGTFTEDGSEGIYTCSFDQATGAMQLKGVTEDKDNPSYLAIHPNRRFLYAANRVREADAPNQGYVSSFAIDPDTGALQRLNRQPTGGSGACYVSVDQRGSSVLVSHYGSGSVARLPLTATGELQPISSLIRHEGSGPNADRQEAPHAHSIVVSPDNRYALAADLGTDKVMVYKLVDDGHRLVANTPPATSVHPGAGPRHIVFHPSGRFVYVINELDSSVSSFAWDGSNGALTPLGSLSTLPPEFTDRSACADIHIHPSGRFLYGSNRGHDSIAIFAIKTQTGRPKAIAHRSTGGKTPRNFALDRTAKYLLAANQQSGTLVSFAITEDGDLEPTGQTLDIPQPVCIKFL